MLKDQFSFMSDFFFDYFFRLPNFFGPWVLSHLALGGCVEYVMLDATYAELELQLTSTVSLLVDNLASSKLSILRLHRQRPELAEYCF